MNLQDPRVVRTIWLVGLTAAAITVGMQIDTVLEAGKPTPGALIALGANAVAATAFLFLLINDVWKRPAQ
jgi:hypothetical protein